MTREYSYLLKVRVADTRELESLITDFFKKLPGLVRTKTEVVLSSPKDGSVIVE